MAELLPLWIEAGFNCCFPVEVAAGNDIVAYRRQYGRQMAYLGGIDKRAIAAGGATMCAEVLRVVPPLLEDGGLILVVTTVCRRTFSWLMMRRMRGCWPR